MTRRSRPRVAIPAPALPLVSYRALRNAGPDEERDAGGCVAGAGEESKAGALHDPAARLGVRLCRLHSKSAETHFPELM